MKKQTFNNLIGSVKQAGEIRRGKAEPNRVFTFKRTPMKSIGITELRRNLSKILKVLNATEGVMLITRRGKPVAVLMSVKAFEMLDHDRRLQALVAQERKPITDRHAENRKRKLKELVAGITEKNLHKVEL